MSMSTLKTLCFVLFFTSLLVGCSNAFDQMKAAYEAENYIQAAQYAVEGYQNPDLRAEVETFLTDNGVTLIDAMLDQGEALERETPPSERAIWYWQSVDNLVQRMIEEDLPLPDLSDVSVFIQDHLDASIIRFTRRLNRDSRTAYESKEYRKSIQLIDKVRDYQTQFPGMDERYDLANKKAARTLSITPIIKPADDLTKFIRNTVSGLLDQETLKADDVLPVSLRIDQVNIPKTITTAVHDRILSNKSRFIRVSIDDPSVDISDTDYYLEAFVDASKEYTLRRPVFSETRVDTLRYSYDDGDSIRWRSTSFSYDVYEVLYRITVQVRANLYLTRTNQKIKSIVFDETVKDDVRFRKKAKNLPLHSLEVEFPDEYLSFPTTAHSLNKSAVIKAAIRKAAKRLSQEVLDEVDRDLDPVVTLL